MTDGDFLRGVFNIVPTPFGPSGALDERSLEELIEFVIGTGVDGVTVLGFLGEAAKLSESERQRVIDISVRTADGRIPVVVGATHASTDRSVAFAADAEARGAAGLMVAPPGLSRPNEPAIRHHYERLCEAIRLPVVVQDYPPASGVYMTPSFIASLAASLPQCRWLKLEDDPTAPKTSAILEANPAIGIFGGLGGAFMLEELQRGAVGTMTGFGFPEILVAIYSHFSAGDVNAARATFFRYLPLIRFENQAGINLTLRKYIYQKRGAMAHASPRRPYAPLDETTLKELDSILDYLALPMPGLVEVD